MFVPNNIYELILPLAIANWIMGTGVIEYPIGQKQRLLSFAYIICTLVGFSYTMYIAVLDLKTYYLNKSTESGNITFKALFYGNICLMMCLIVIAWIRSKSTREGISHTGICDQSLEQIGIRKNYEKYFKYQIYLLIACFMCVVIFGVCSFLWMFERHTPLSMRIALVVTMNLPATVMFIVDITFLCWIRYSGIKFKELNELLRSMLTTTPESPQHKRVLKMRDDWNKGIATYIDPSKRTKENVDIMRSAKQVHLELTKAAKNTNEIYGVQILLSMTASFVLITSLLYNAYVIVWKHDDAEEFRREIISLCCWILFYASKIFAINHTCAKTSAEAANTGDIICELYEPSTTKEFRAEIRDFTLQLIQNPLTFTASGFFNLDYTFIHGVIGSVTTYLVILIQFGDIQKPSNIASSTTTSTEVTILSGNVTTTNVMP